MLETRQSFETLPEPLRKAGSKREYLKIKEGLYSGLQDPIALLVTDVVQESDEHSKERLYVRLYSYVPFPVTKSPYDASLFLVADSIPDLNVGMVPHNCVMPIIARFPGYSERKLTILKAGEPIPINDIVNSALLNSFVDLSNGEYSESFPPKETELLQILPIWNRYASALLDLDIDAVTEAATSFCSAAAKEMDLILSDSSAIAQFASVLLWASEYWITDQLILEMQNDFAKHLVSTIENGHFSLIPPAPLLRERWEESKKYRHIVEAKHLVENTLVSISEALAKEELESTVFAKMAIAILAKHPKLTGWVALHQMPAGIESVESQMQQAEIAFKKLVAGIKGDYAFEECRLTVPMQALNGTAFAWRS